MNLKTRGLQCLLSLTCSDRTAHTETVQSRSQSKVHPHSVISATSKKMGCKHTALTDPTVEQTSLKVFMTLIRAYHSHKGRCNAFKDSMIHEIAWICNSHHISQLATFFIDWHAKGSNTFML